MDRARARLARMLVKGSDLAVTLGLNPYIAYSFIEPTFRSLVAEGYRANSAVFACVSTLAFAFIEPRLRVFSDEASGGQTPVTNHPLAKVLAAPTEGMSVTDLLQLSLINLAIGGNCYWLKVRGNGGMVRELIPLNDSQMEPIAGGNQIISHYELIESNGRKKVLKKDVVHFRWMWDPLHPWKGTAPLVAAAREVDTENEAAQYVFSVLKNNAVPPIAIVAPSDSMVDEDQAKRMKASWEDDYGGDNRGKVAVLWGGVDVKQLSFNLQQLAYDALRNIPEARIAAVLRVPPIVAGLNVGLANATYSNAEQAARWMTERTLIPLWRMVEEKITSDLIPEFDDMNTAPNVSVGFDLSSVVALQEQITEKRAWVSQSWTGGLITKNEGRAYLGLPRDTNGDVYQQGIAVTEVAAALEKNASSAKAKSATNYARLMEQIPQDAPGETKRANARSMSANAGNTKASLMRQAVAMVQAQRKVRAAVGKKMESALDDYFVELAKRVRERAEKTWMPQAMEAKGLPSVDDLLLPSDDDALENIVRGYYGSIMELSWDIYNVSLGVDLAFDLTDPIVTQILGDSSKRVRMISDTTRESLRTLLQIGSEGGWSIDDLVRGDPANDIPGLRDIVEETYKNRARTIARTELGTCQNKAATGRYGAAGIEKVLVLDNGLSDDDDACKQINGKIKTLAWAEANPLAHPNCTRCYSPVVPGMEEE